MEDEIIIRFTEDLLGVLFENGEHANFKKGDLARARIEHKLYGDVAIIDYG